MACNPHLHKHRSRHLTAPPHEMGGRRGPSTTGACETDAAQRRAHRQRQHVPGGDSLREAVRVRATTPPTPLVGRRGQHPGPPCIEGHRRADCFCDSRARLASRPPSRSPSVRALSPTTRSFSSRRGAIREPHVSRLSHRFGLPGSPERLAPTSRPLARWRLRL
ncbi:uncharacterized protein BDZ99DRAFT_531810 [Mytilinidion resinicola]|uniref:Uncharacterized protein n=1 Tax=Mytilinidion resinicola TaxID=574789 RepID=A0A6A6YNB8_9PEZI|nr:uncharacterized protein BDZ99DRAFT_531810 [Mytilinidion resinicola]KAF2809465.1 hypothetical protein BDZ99DRAFT_531810 [Mytilinidion resinicola]